MLFVKLFGASILMLPSTLGFGREVGNVFVHDCERRMRRHGRVNDTLTEMSDQPAPAHTGFEKDKAFLDETIVSWNSHCEVICIVLLTHFGGSSRKNPGCGAVQCSVCTMCTVLRHGTTYGKSGTSRMLPNAVQLSFHSHRVSRH